MAHWFAAPNDLGRWGILVRSSAPARPPAAAGTRDRREHESADAGTYAFLALTTTGDIAPNWTVGLLSGLDGLAGGYLGAWLQPHLQETSLRLLLGALAIAVAALYTVQGII